MPFIDQLFHNLHVIYSSINAKTLSSIGKMSESLTHLQTYFTQKVSRHYDLITHHILKSNHSLTRIYFKNTHHKILVCFSMSCLIRSNYTAHF